MDRAKQHWEILEKLGTDLANRVREFMVIGNDGDGVIVATEDGLAFWFGTIKFGWSKSRTATEPTPLDVPGELVQMAHDSSHVFLLNKRGEIYSMGQNDLGQRTVNKQTQFISKLISIPQHKFISVRCGRGHSVALTDDGKCWAWGDNDYGQVGVSSSTAVIHLSPSQIVELDSHRIVAVECGGRHSLALTDLGEVYAWGWNDKGQLGNGSTSYQPTPIRIPTPSSVQSMAAGSRHTLLLTQTGEVYSCGDNEWFQLGFPTDIDFNSDLSRVQGLPPISQIESHHDANLSIAMTSYQRCFIWGYLNGGRSFSTPRKLPRAYSTVESPLSFSFSNHCNTPHSVSIPETPPSRLAIQMSRIFDVPNFSDVQFVVEQRTIHAHRIILSSSSEYFARMFSERWMAPVDPEDPIVRVTIPDHSYSAFHSFLRFLYTDCLEVSSDLLPELFELASQYLVPELQQLCLSRMISTVTPATCCLYYQLTHRHSLPELEDFQQDLVHFASTRMSEITPTAAYQSMEPDLRDNLTNAAQNTKHSVHLIGQFKSQFSK